MPGRCVAPSLLLLGLIVAPCGSVALALPVTVPVTCDASVCYGAANAAIAADGFGTSLSLFTGEVFAGTPSADWDINIAYVGGFNPAHPWVLSVNKQDVPQSLFIADYGAALVGHYGGSNNDIPLTHLLPQGTWVGPAGTSGPGGTFGSTYLDDLSLNVDATFTATTGLFGFRLFNMDDLSFYYGWVRLALSGSGSPAQGTIVDFGYAKNPDTGLLAGLPLTSPSPVPLPAALPLFATAVGAAAAFSRYRRRKADS